MEELLDIVSENGQPSGQIAPKDIAHRMGLWHNTIHVWLYTEDRRVLLQQRSHRKSIFPLLWDVSAAGHIGAGEDFKSAAIREVEEELGILLSPENLDKVGVNKHASTYANGAVQDNEFHHVYVSKFIPERHTIKINKEEVETVKWVSLEDFKTLLDTPNNHHFVKTNRDYYLSIRAHVKNLFP